MLLPKKKTVKNIVKKMRKKRGSSSKSKSPQLRSLKKTKILNSSNVRSSASLNSSFDNVDKVLENKNIVLCEGEIMRYKPGIQKDFVSRWLQLTPLSL
jgi:hypothetical protein